MKYSISEKTFKNRTLNFDKFMQYLKTKINVQKYIALKKKNSLYSTNKK